MKTTYHVATIAGIPIRLDISLLILIGMILFGCFSFEDGILTSLRDGMTLALLLLLSIVLHELGHSLASMQFGCRVRGITLMLLGGRADLSHIPTQPRQELIIAMAGPLVSLALWQIGEFGTRRLTSLPETALVHYALLVTTVLVDINASLFVFNLAPAFPMDGGRILRALLAHRLGRLRATHIALNVGRVLTIGSLFWVLTGPAEIHIAQQQWTIAGHVFSFGPINMGFNRWMLGLIAFFILSAAEQEYRMVLAEDEYLRHGQRAPWMPTETPEDQIVISPPPYERKPIPFPTRHRWWKWRK